jgi:hypothetical protein
MNLRRLRKYVFLALVGAGLLVPALPSGALDYDLGCGDVGVAQVVAGQRAMRVTCNDGTMINYRWD